MRSLSVFLLYLVLSKVSLFSQTKTILYIGTYTQGQPDSGIYVCNFNSKTGEINKLSSGQQLVNPSFINLSPNGAYLYACTNSKLPEHGKVAAFSIDSIKGKLNFINSQSSAGENPVYISVHPYKNYVVNANYTEGNLSVYKTLTDGSIGEAIQILAFKDSSVNASRQEKSHLHAAVFSPDGKFVFFPDLGADKIRVFEFNDANEKPLIEKTELTVKSIPGSGPRHLTIHPNGKFIYVIEELSGTISAYNYYNGKMDSIQRVVSYSKPSKDYASADIHISPDGQFLYASNRIENTISIFYINPNNGKLSLVGHQPTLGDHPRNFAIDPSGNYLLVANLGSNTIVVFKRNLKSGLLKTTGYQLKVPRPSCLQMRVYN